MEDKCQFCGVEEILPGVSTSHFFDKETELVAPCGNWKWVGTDNIKRVKACYDRQIAALQTELQAAREELARARELLKESNDLCIMLAAGLPFEGIKYNTNHPFSIKAKKWELYT